MAEAAQLESRRVLITGEDTDLADRIGEVFEDAGAVVERPRGAHAKGADGTAAADAALRELGGIDVLINVGPAEFPGDSLYPEKRSRKVEEALTRSMERLVTTTEAALEGMHAGASIINIVALSVERPTAAHEALAAAVVDTTQAWAAFLVDRGIRANVVVGGPVIGPAAEGTLARCSPWTARDGAAQLDAVVYLASERSCHVSGSVISVARALDHPEEDLPSAPET